MTSLPEFCRREECDWPRAAHSVFCAVHHDEQLKKLGLVPPPHTPDEVFVRQIRRMLKLHVDREIISSREFCGGVVDEFVNLYASGREDFWTIGLALLPDQLATELATFCRQRPDPRVFDQGGGIFAPGQNAGEQATLLAQAKLLSILDGRSRSSTSETDPLA